MSELRSAGLGRGGGPWATQPGTAPAHPGGPRMSDIGQPLRIVEDEPIAWPDEEPLAIPEPAPPAPAQEPAPAP